jgi:hypothetical protein
LRMRAEKMARCGLQGEVLARAGNRRAAGVHQVSGGVG